MLSVSTNCENVERSVHALGKPGGSVNPKKAEIMGGVGLGLFLLFLSHLLEGMWNRKML